MIVEYAKEVNDLWQGGNTLLAPEAPFLTAWDDERKTRLTNAHPDMAKEKISSG